ncbi:hypothetical protein TKK_0010868 [Trichogramma kaykai]|uniref:USP domain-containing protein n=1 Tax=Trichogramma kaykai TaxID=54128 RepID=A0ABD2WUV5_9HYME
MAPPIDHEYRFNVLKDYVFDLFNDCGDLCSDSHNLWDVISEKLNIQKKNLYLYVKQDRGLQGDLGIKTKLMIHRRNLKGKHGSSTSNTEIEESKDELSENEDEMNFEIFNNQFIDDSIVIGKDIENREEDRINVVTNIRRVMNDIQFKSAVRFLGWFPSFKIFYWSPYQIFHLKTKRFEFLDMHVLENIVHPFEAFGRIIDDIKVILITAVDSNINYSLAQVITNDTDWDMDLFFSEWIRSGAIINHLFCPCKLGIIFSAIRNTNSHMTVTNYLNRCFEFYKSDETNKNNYQKRLPKGIVQIKIVDLIKYIKHLKCFDRDGVRNFYIYCFIHLSTITSTTEFKIFLKKVLILMQSEYENGEVKSLKTEFLTLFNSNYSNVNLNVDYSEDMENLISEMNRNKNVTDYFEAYSKQILEKCNNTGDIIDDLNCYYNQKFVPYTIKILSCFPVWCSFLYKSANPITNEKASSSTFFIFNTPTRVDEFIKQHILSLSQEKMISPPSTSPIEDSYIDNKDVYFHENWFAQGEDDFCVISNNLNVKNNNDLPNDCVSNEHKTDFTEIKLNFSSNNCEDSQIKCVTNENTTDIPTTDFNSPWFQNVATVLDLYDSESSLDISTNHSIASKTCTLENYNVMKSQTNSNDNEQFNFSFSMTGHLKNGGKLKPKKMINDVLYQFTNTCAYDTITEILTHALGNFNHFKEYIDNNKNQLLSVNYKCFVSSLIDYYNKGTYGSVYTYRAYLMLTVRDIKPDENNEVDCNTNISELFSTLMGAYDNIEEIIHCRECSITYSANVTTVNIPNVHIVHNKFSNLEDEINVYFTQERLKYCTECKKVTGATTLILGSYLWINTEDAYYKPLYNTSSTKKETFDYYSEVKDIPKEIKITGRTLVLCGVARYTPGRKMGHYIAYCKSIGHFWYEINDSGNKTRLKTEDLPKMKMAGIFYVVNSE